MKFAPGTKVSSTFGFSFILTISTKHSFKTSLFPERRLISKLTDLSAEKQTLTNPKLSLSTLTNIACSARKTSKSPEVFCLPSRALFVEAGTSSTAQLCTRSSSALRPLSWHTAGLQGTPSTDCRHRGINQQASKQSFNGQMQGWHLTGYGNLQFSCRGTLKGLQVIYWVLQWGVHTVSIYKLKKLHFAEISCISSVIHCTLLLKGDSALFVISFLALHNFF